MHAYIAGTGSFIPSKKVNNIELYERISNFNKERAVLSLTKKGTDVSNLSDAEIFDRWVRQVSGIIERPFISENELERWHQVEEMACRASLKAIEDAGIHKDEIDCIVFATYTSETIIPNPACTLSNMLEISGCAGITCNTACSGFVDALGDAYLRILSGKYKNILVVASEYMSNKLDFTDPTTAILFGDAAGACILRAGEEGVYAFYSEMSYNDEHIKMKYSYPIQMGGGPLVQKKAVNAMYNAAVKALEECGRDMTDIDFVVPHQANMRILESLEQKMKLEENKMVKAIYTTGNISCATIPVALDLFRLGKLENTSYKTGSNICLVSVGGGYMFGSVIVKI